MGGLTKDADLPSSRATVIKYTEATKGNWLHYQDTRVGFAPCPGCLYGSSGELHCIRKYSGLTEDTWSFSHEKRAGEHHSWKTSAFLLLMMRLDEVTYAKI